MIVKYYKNNKLALANRNRYLDISSAVPFSTEEQRKVLLNDGVSTSVKTSKNNVCDYVTIDNTRWFVVSYTYLNGSQVILNLKRDIIGEFGVNGMYGKVDRGYVENDNILKYRKELSLNQILYSRKKLRPSSNNYGNYVVENHENEMWGILYINKPSSAADSVTVPIRGYSPQVVDLSYIENGSTYVTSMINPTDRYSAKLKIGAIISVRRNETNPSIKYFDAGCYFTFREGYGYILNTYAGEIGEPLPDKITFDYEISGSTYRLDAEEYFARNIFAYKLGQQVKNNFSSFFPAVLQTQQAPSGYENATIRVDDKYYNYSVENTVRKEYGVNLSESERITAITSITNNQYYPIEYRQDSLVMTYADISLRYGNTSYQSSEVDYTVKTFTYNEVSASQAGDLVIDLTQQFIDEPFCIYVMPLYGVSIKDNSGNVLYSINKDKAFGVFNDIIQNLSGDNGYLVDAQIYPYCPQLTKVGSEIGGCPLFEISRTSYSTMTQISLYPNEDVKKEYIENEYNIVAPDQSSVFTFKYYDYKTEDTSTSPLSIEIKTALKPFAIISSAVIVRDDNSLMGIYHHSDLNGCQPSSNGFECSIASNAFETYKRNNSNYQAIFDKQQEKLRREHEAETTNEAVSVAVNTLSAASMGAIAGASAADVGIIKAGKPVAAGVGAAAAGSIVAGAMIGQIVVNEQLREFEREYQQDMFNLEIGTIKNIPNSINRISSFNELILDEFCYVVETYSCSSYEKTVVDNYILKYAYEIGVYDYLSNYIKDGWFLRASILQSNLPSNLHIAANSELKGGVYINATL